MVFPVVDILWDNGVEGNYWSDYKSRYPEAVEVGNSGVGNITYVSNIPPKEVTDRHPLMKPYNFETPPPPEIPELNLTILPTIFVLTLILTFFIEIKIFRKNE